uniref:Ankyrin repeat domain-containing protein n=1 Tax=Araucaria cunninghamii TaxID=56994 RepID=A0A0D6QV18_ARACU
MTSNVMAQMDIKQYEHSPVHLAVANRDYTMLRQIFASLPRLAKAGEVNTEEESIRAEERADIISQSIDRRDVPGRETPLHLAVRMKDAVAVDLLMAAGADWSLQNEQGWSALQEAVCAREDNLALIITRYYQPMAWAKWCRRLPRIIGTLRRMRDFYMELNFQFESSVIPFISRIAPSDTYKIWKRGSNFRTDMTLAGFDGFRIQRSDQSFLFLGEGTEDGKLAPGSLIMLNHKEKEITNALEGAGAFPSEAEVAQEVAQMSQTSLYRPGIDVTQAELVPQLTWRRQERTETVGLWKAKIYDMLHVVVSVRSRRFPGAMSDEELFAAESDQYEGEQGVYDEILTEEEKRQLENALNTAQDDATEGLEDDGSVSFGRNGSFREENDSVSAPECKQNGFAEVADSAREEKKGWFSWKRQSKNDGVKRTGSARYSVSVEDVKDGGSSSSGADDSSSMAKKSSGLTPSNSCRSVEGDDSISAKKGKEKASKKGKKESDKMKKCSTSGDTKK